MSNEMLRRIQMRDYARGRMRGRNRDREFPQEQTDMHYPQMYSNEYAMGGRVIDHASRNRYTPRGFDSREQDYRSGNPAYAESDYARRGDYAMSNGRNDYHYVYPFEIAGRVGREHYYPMHDYAGAESPYLTDQELMEWDKRLLDSMEEHAKQSFKKEQVLKEAKEVGIRFDKFTELEFYVTVLMMYTDYHKTLGTANHDIYFKLAKDWLCDEDTALQYGENLAAYHDKVVMGL